jgi:hypothetical protein
MARYTSFIAAALLLALIAAPAAQAASGRQLAQARNAPANKSKGGSSSRGPTGELYSCVRNGPFPFSPYYSANSQADILLHEQQVRLARPALRVLTALMVPPVPRVPLVPLAPRASGPPARLVPLALPAPRAQLALLGKFDALQGCLKWLEFYTMHSHQIENPTHHRSAGTVNLVGSASSWTGSITVANPGACTSCKCPAADGPLCNTCFGTSGPCRCITTVISSSGTATPSCVVPATGPTTIAGVLVYSYVGTAPVAQLGCPAGDVAYVTQCSATGSGSSDPSFSPNGNIATCALTAALNPQPIDPQSAWCMTTA